MQRHPLPHFRLTTTRIEIAVLGQLVWPALVYVSSVRGTGLLFYDYLLVLSQEVELVWKSKFRLSTSLYLISRYPLIARMLILVCAESSLPQVCVPLHVGCIKPQFSIVGLHPKRGKCYSMEMTAARPY
jgi:hypothetical protein